MVKLSNSTGLVNFFLNEKVDIFNLELQITTIISGTLSYPWDTVLRRMMVDSGRPKHLKRFDSSRHAIEMIYSQGGIKAFYKVKILT